MLLFVTACIEMPTQSAPTEESAVEQDATLVPRGTFPAQTEAEVCTIISETACLVGACELGLHDVFTRTTENCCENGVCHIERYKLCGC
ncbi:MAG: hypothetical protein ABIY55_35400 [Kofleriaceae bacterium]